MLKAIVYTEIEKILIDESLRAPCLNRSVWENDELQGLRKKIKAFYLREQKNTCVYCRVKLPSNNGRAWDVDHIISRGANGSFMFEPRNLCVSCIDCNINKGEKK